MQSKKVIGNQGAVAFSLFPVFGHTHEYIFSHLCYLHVIHQNNFFHPFVNTNILVLIN